MKLLLTSAGLTNKSISDVLFDLVGKKPEDTNIVFVPTASNIEKGDKGWLIDDLRRLQKHNFKQIEIADIAALSEEMWRPRFEEADILYFEGGETFYLMEWINKSGLAKFLPEYLKTKVYVGSSAGSMAASKDLALPISKVIYEGDEGRTENMKALGLVDFYVLPHLNSKYFPKVREENIRKAIQGMSEKVYALDDQSALKIIDGETEIITEREYLVFN